MGDLIFLIVIVCLVCILCGCLLKIYHIRKKVSELTENLSNVEINHINQKTLIKETDLLAPLVYQVNQIVYDYEEKLRDLQAADETNKQLMTSFSMPCKRVDFSSSIKKRWTRSPSGLFQNGKQIMNTS